MGKLNLTYMRPQSARGYRYLAVPKELIENPAFSGLDFGAIILYAKNAGTGQPVRAARGQVHGRKRAAVHHLHSGADVAGFAALPSHCHQTDKAACGHRAH